MEKQGHLGSEQPPSYDSIEKNHSQYPMSQSTPSAPIQEYPPAPASAQGYPPAPAQGYPPPSATHGYPTSPIQGYPPAPGQGYQTGPGPTQGYQPSLAQGYQPVPTQEHQTTSAPAAPEKQLYPKQQYQTASSQGYQPQVSGYPPPPPQPLFITPSFGPNPSAMLCPNCRAQIVTRVDYEIGTKTHLIAGAMCIFGLVLCAFIPYLLNIAKVPHHYCPNCNAFLGTYSECDL